MNVHVTEMIHDDALRMLEGKVNIVRWDNPKVQDFTEADAVIVRTSRVTREQILAAPRLKIIGKHGVGLDNIDLNAAKELGRWVINTPHANVESVAELVVGMMLAAARQIPRAHGMLCRGIEKIAPKELVGVELSGKNAGLIGLGRIGLRTGAILQQGFGMKLFGYDPFLSAERFAALGIERCETVEDLLPHADFINISVPLTPETKDLMNPARFALCRKEAILVNAARGGIVNEDALFTALTTGQIRAAGMDVFTVEPPSKDHPLFTLPNFLGTPHVGASTDGGLIRMGTTVAADVLRIMNGQAPVHPVVTPA